jgi:hypothetical protein
MRLAEVTTQESVHPSHMKGRSELQSACLGICRISFDGFRIMLHSFWILCILEKFIPCKNSMIPFSITDCHINSIKPAQTYVGLNVEL